MAYRLHSQKTASITCDVVSSKMIWDKRIVSSHNPSTSCMLYNPAGRADNQVAAMSAPWA
jgi:hypothetical protein